jgi:hypothetical protein
MRLRLQPSQSTWSGEIHEGYRFRCLKGLIDVALELQRMIIAQIEEPPPPCSLARSVANAAFTISRWMTSVPSSTSTPERDHCLEGLRHPQTSSSMKSLRESGCEQVGGVSRGTTNRNSANSRSSKRPNEQRTANSRPPRQPELRTTNCEQSRTHAEEGAAEHKQWRGCV